MTFPNDVTDLHVTLYGALTGASHEQWSSEFLWFFGWLLDRQRDSAAAPRAAVLESSVFSIRAVYSLAAGFASGDSASVSRVQRNPYLVSLN